MHFFWNYNTFCCVNSIIALLRILLLTAEFLRKRRARDNQWMVEWMMKRACGSSLQKKWKVDCWAFVHLALHTKWFECRICCMNEWSYIWPCFSFSLVRRKSLRKWMSSSNLLPPQNKNWKWTFRQSGVSQLFLLFAPLIQRQWVSYFLCCSKTLHFVVKCPLW